VQPGLVIEITPEKSAHAFTVLFKAGKLAVITVEESGVDPAVPYKSTAPESRMSISG
jgi:hypothetical protein